MRFPVSILAFFATTSLASAQIPILRWDDPTDLGYGSETTFRQLSDIDGDGFPEVMFAHRNPGGSNAEIWFYSLALEQPLIILPGSVMETSFSAHATLTISDVNGDGRRDALIRRIDDFGLGSLKISDGLTGSTIWNTDGNTLGDNPSMLSEVEDIDGDGIPDVVTILIKPSPIFTTKEGRMISGADGTILYSFSEPFDMVFPFSLGDLDGDGFGDFGLRPQLGSNFYIYSGATGTQIQVLSGAADTTHSRNSMVPVGDINGDGLNDWAETWEQSSFPVDSSIHFFTDIFNPTEIGVFDAEFFDTSLGSTPIFAHDFDGDGMQDVVFRNLTSSLAADSVTLYSPANGILREWSHPVNPRLHALEEDWNGDGIPDLLLQTAIVTSETLLVGDPAQHLKSLTSQISQSAGGHFSFLTDFGPQFANRKVHMVAGNGETRPFKAFIQSIPGAPDQMFGFPFSPTSLTRRIFNHRLSPGTSDWTDTLDSNGQATFHILVQPWRIPVSMIGKDLHFTALVESLTPPFIETSTERVSVTVTP